VTHACAFVLHERRSSHEFQHDVNNQAGFEAVDATQAAWRRHRVAPVLALPHDPLDRASNEPSAQARIAG
jgi:hypothetical protein